MSGVLLFFFFLLTLNPPPHLKITQKNDNTPRIRKETGSWALSEQQPRGSPVDVFPSSGIWERGRMQGVEVGSWLLRLFQIRDGKCSVPKDGWERDGFSSQTWAKNSYLPPKLESLLDWQRLDPDQVFRFDSDSAEYLLVNILTGAGHLAILK